MRNESAVLNDVARIDQQLTALGDRVDDMTTNITKVHKVADDLSSKVGHHIKKSGETTVSITNRMNSLIEDTNARLNDFASRLESRTMGSPRLATSRVFVAPGIGPGGGTTIDNADSTTVALTEGPNDVDRYGGTDACGNDTGAGTPDAHATPDPAPPGVTVPTTPLRSIDPAGLVLPEDVYTLPSGHFGSGLGGPSTSSTRRVLHGSHRKRDAARDNTTDRQSPERDTTAMNARAAHMAGQAGQFAVDQPVYLLSTPIPLHAQRQSLQSPHPPLTQISTMMNTPRTM